MTAPSHGTMDKKPSKEKKRPQDNAEDVGEIIILHFMFETDTATDTF